MNLPFSRMGAVLIVFAVILSVGPTAAASYRVPLTAYGAPDLQGLWSSASITTLERPAQFKDLEISDDQATAFERGHSGVPDPAQGGPVGQDESEWWDMGGKMARIDGRPRTSWIIHPANGRLPYTPAGAAALQTRQAGGMRNFDGPETRPAAERCLMGLGGTSLPPMLNAGYNNLVQIVQTRDHVVLLTEMNVGPRIIPLGDKAPEPGVSWNGYSTGRWEGNTLVVETARFHTGSQWRAPSRLFVSSAGKVTERFTRVSADEIRYAFKVDDPAIFSQAWEGEMPLRQSPGPIYEFACHEGNYSLANILGGARVGERNASSGASPTMPASTVPPR